MSDRAEDVAEACARLRGVLAETYGLGRRDFVKALGQAVAGSALLGALPAFAADSPITALVFGGVWKQAMATAFGGPFTQKTGIPVRYQEPYNFARLQAMHMAKAQQVDIASVQGAEIIVAERLNMIAPLDWSVIDRSQLSPRQLRHPNTIGGHTLSFIFVYNKKTWPGAHHPNSWADFWDVEKFPGRRVVRRVEQVTLIEAALKADGVGEENFYPIDIDRAFRSLDRIKPHVRAWYSDNSQGQQMIEQEDVDLITMVNGRASDSIVNHGAPFEIVWNEAICEAGAQGWLNPVGSPNPAGAMKFLDLVGRPEYQAVFAKLLYYAPQNPKAFDFIEPAIAKQLPTYPANAKIAHMMRYDWWTDNIVKVQRRFEQWLQA